MASNQAGEVALTWADSFVRDLLSESEKYRDVLRTLSDDVIRDAAIHLDSSTEEWKAASDILYNRAVGSTSYALVEVDEEADDEILPVLPTITPPSPAVYDETDWRLWDAVNELLKAQAEADKDIDRLVDEVKESNEGTYQEVKRWLSDFTDDLHSTLWGWIPELTNDASIYLASLPAMLLFKSFTNFFFEED